MQSQSKRVWNVVWCPIVACHSSIFSAKRTNAYEKATHASHWLGLVRVRIWHGSHSRRSTLVSNTGSNSNSIFLFAHWIFYYFGWCRDDLDLHVITPNGFEIYFGDRGDPSSGELDQDDIPNVKGSYVENVFFPLDGSALKGAYTYFVDNFNPIGSTPDRWTLQVFVGDTLVSSNSGLTEMEDENTMFNFTRSWNNFEAVYIQITLYAIVKQPFYSQLFGDHTG